MAKLKNELSAKYFSSPDVSCNNQDQYTILKMFEQDEAAMEDLRKRVEKGRKEHIKGTKKAENIIVY